VDTGSREEDASKQESRASVSMQQFEVPRDQSLRHICDAANAKDKCQEKAAAVANFRHKMTAKRGDPT
jgi:hypothetical protein